MLGMAHTRPHHYSCLSPTCPPLTLSPTLTLPALLPKAVELMLVVQTLLPVPTFLQSFVPANVSLLPPSGLYKGFTSSIPSLGTIMALWENGIDVLSEDLDIDDSAFGFSIQRDFPTLALPSYSMYLWGRGACWSHQLTHMLTPPLHCVGEGTMFDAPPTLGEVFEAGTGQYPMLEFSSSTSGPHHCPFMSIRKSVDASSGYAFLETAMSRDGRIMWQASLVNASVSRGRSAGHQPHCSLCSHLPSPLPSPPSHSPSLRRPPLQWATSSCQRSAWPTLCASTSPAPLCAACVCAACVCVLRGADKK